MAQILIFLVSTTEFLRVL